MWSLGFILNTKIRINPVGSLAIPTHLIRVFCVGALHAIFVWNISTHSHTHTLTYNMDTLTMAPQPVAALPSDANPSAHLAPQQMAVGISNSGSNTTTATTTMTTAPAPSSNTTTNGSISGGGGAGEGSRLSEAAAIRKELRQARIGSSSSMDSTSSNMMFRKSYPSSEMNASFSSTSVAGSIMVSVSVFTLIYFFTYN